MASQTSSVSNKGGRATILVVEDDLDLAAEICLGLGKLGYEVSHAATGPDGLKAVRNQAPALLIADRMLPGRDGLSMIEAIRGEGFHTPVLVLSALSSVHERVRGLRAGGDDYLVKPFVMDELAARVEALLRRPAPLRETMLRVGSLEMDLIERTVSRDGRAIQLSPREFRLLEYFMRRPGQMVTRSMLLEEVWNYRFSPQTNLVDVHIGRLRRKVGGPEDAPMIESVRGIGFILHAPD